MTKTLNVLGVRVDAVTAREALDTIEGYIRQGEPHQIVTANAEIIYQASRDKKMQRVINEASLVTADGSGVVWASRQLGTPLKERVTGIDLVNSICEQSAKKGWRIYILGSAPGVADQAAENIMKKYPGCNIVGTHHGYFKEKEEREIIAEIKSKKPDVLFVALGAPKQEYWIVEHQEEIKVPVAMGIGGSMDVLSGNVKRAPKWMQKMSLEWLYRLLIQPSRFKRVLALPKFMLAVKLQKN